MPPPATVWAPPDTRRPRTPVRPPAQCNVPPARSARPRLLPSPPARAKPGSRAVSRHQPVSVVTAAPQQRPQHQTSAPKAARPAVAQTVRAPVSETAVVPYDPAVAGAIALLRTHAQSSEEQLEQELPFQAILDMESLLTRSRDLIHMLSFQLKNLCPAFTKQGPHRINGSRSPMRSCAP